MIVDVHTHLPKYKERAENKAENETGEVKDALINVTAETHEMEKRVKLIHDHNFRYFMVSEGLNCSKTSRYHINHEISEIVIVN